MQPSSQIHRGFLVYSFEWIPVGQLVGRGREGGKKRGRWKEKMEREKKKESYINCKKCPSSRGCCSSMAWKE